MKRLILLLVIVMVVVAFGFSLISVSGSTDSVNASAMLANLGSDTSGYRRAIGARD